MMPTLTILNVLLFAPLDTLHASEALSPVGDIDAKTPASAAKDGWKLSFSEEFEGQQVDTNKWVIKDQKERLATNVSVSAGNTICNAEEEVLLSTKVASFAGKASSALEGKSMDVDYVRIYQKKE